MFAKLNILMIFSCLSFCGAKNAEINFDILFDDEKQRTNDELLFIGRISDNGKLNEFKASIICNQTVECNNGGSCLNNVCLCLPGTSGPLCATIDGCKDLNCEKDKTAICSYDKRNFKAYCNCQSRYRAFDDEENVCKDCRCDRCKGEFCIGDSVKCEFIKSKKACTCIQPNYKFNYQTEMCQFCYCGDKNVESCAIDDDGKTICTCDYGYKYDGISCEYCKCENGDCGFEHYKKVCSCYPGYYNDDQICRQCSCGENGKCEYDWWGKEKECTCNPGYIKVSGKCVGKENCYCGENANCSLVSGEKKCECPEGFESVNGLCADINECYSPNACHPYTKCINTVGSYECKCKEGFQLSISNNMECEDVNECLSANPCTSSDKECLNTVGSFKCVCKAGFATRLDSNSPIICESQNSWKLGYGLFIGIFGAVIIGLSTILYLKLRN